MELMELIKYVNNIEEVELPLMEERLREIIRRMLFMFEYTTTSGIELKQNNFTINW